MVVYKDGCVMCGKPCLGNSCPYKNEMHLYCDECKTEEDTLYEYDDGSQLCLECLLSHFRRVTV